MNVRLREFTSNDLPGLESCVRNSDITQYMSRWAPRSFLNGRWSPDLVRWWAIVADGQDIGALWIEKSSAGDTVADLGILIGESQKRGCGAGEYAIRLAEADVKANWHVKEVRLRVRQSNQRAIRCYEKVGFLPSRFMEKDGADEERISVMEMAHHLTNALSKVP